MTREEAKAYFKRHIDLYCVTGICREAEEMAIQALEQEPCEDAISRQAVEDKLLKLCNQLEGIFANIRMQNQDESVCGLCEYDCPTPYECPGFDTEDCFKLAYEIRYEWQSTEDLHSVKPQERTGHWNLFHTTEHGMREDSYFKCNRCNYESYKEYNFCPDCGACMTIDCSACRFRIECDEWIE